MNPMIRNFVAGEFCAARSEKSRSKVNPATLESLGDAPDSNAVDMVFAIQAAHKALMTYSSTSVSERVALLTKMASALETRAQDFARTAALEAGMPIAFSQEFDIAPAIATFRDCAERVARLDGSNVGPAVSIQQPVGVCGLISSWSQPLLTMATQLAPCLAMGNTAVVKPSEQASLTAHLLAETLSEVPAGVVNIIHGGREPALTLTQHPGVPLIAFTGSTETGVLVQTAAAAQVKRVSLELGGKNAFVVLKDADLKKAAGAAAQAAFAAAGQSCLSTSRLYVQQDVYEPFMTEFRARVRELTVGNPLDGATIVGPLVSAEQLDRVNAALAQALKEGGKATVGGEGATGQGYFFAPTIIEDLDHCSELWASETLGPIVLVQSFKYPHDGVKWANTSTYGLAASLWTADPTRAQKLARDLNVGTVWVNSWGVRNPAAPYGGVRRSGQGRLGGDRGLEFFSEQKTIYGA
ncbi:unnamed protein product [Sphagnum balticum]